MFDIPQTVSMRARMLLVLLCIVSANAFAVDKVKVSLQPAWLYKINADLDKKPDRKDISGGYYYSLMDHQVNLITQTDYNHIIRHIENESGVQNASEISVIFSPEFQQVIFHKVTLLRNGVIVSELKPAQIKVVQEETEASDFEYNGLKRAFVLLKDVRKGDNIEYAYSIVGFNPVFENRYADKIYFGFDTPICNYFETVIAPVERNLNIKCFNDAPLPVKEDQGNTRIYHWNNPKLKSWQAQNGVPLWYDNSSYVTITEYNTWQDVTQWGMRLFNNYQYELPAPLKERIVEWRKQANGDQDIFTNLAIHFVQDEVRYLGMEIGTHTHKPHSPAEVYQQLFGDCKDKSLLLATILQKENIPAYVALVNTTTRSRLIDVAPSTLAFDHAIVAIQRAANYIFIDPTLASQRGELVNMYVPAYGYALLIKDKETTLKPVDPGFLFNTLIIEELEVSYYDTTHFKVRTVYAGGSADYFRGSLSGSGAKDIEESSLKFYEKYYEGIQQNDSLEIADDSSKNEIDVQERYSIPKLMVADADGKNNFEVFAKQIYDILPDPTTVLKNAPVALDFPLSMQYRMELTMPERATLDGEALHIKNDSYEFDFDPVVRGNEITLQYSIKIFKDHIPESELAAYRADYKKIMAIIAFEFSNPGEETATRSSKSGKVNDDIHWGLVLFALGLIAILGFAVKKVNNLSVHLPYEAGSGWPIGGWLVVLGISLGLVSVFRLYLLATQEYFSKSYWNALYKSSGRLLQFSWATELALSLFWLCGSISLFYWFLNRRDIFPRLFLWYLGSLAGGQLLLTILYSLDGKTGSSLRPELVADLARTVFYGLIWSAYVLRSDRVKCTFLERVS